MSIVQDSGGGTLNNFTLSTVSKYLSLVFLCLTTLSTIGLAISTGILDSRYKLLRKGYIDQTNSLQQCLKEQQNIVVPDLQCDSMYVIKGTYQGNNYTRYVKFGLGNLTESIEELEEATIEAFSGTFPSDAKYYNTVDLYPDGSLVLGMKNAQGTPIYSGDGVQWGLPYTQVGVNITVPIVITELDSSTGIRAKSIKSVKSGIVVEGDITTTDDTGIDVVGKISAGGNGIYVQKGVSSGEIGVRIDGNLEAEESGLMVDNIVSKQGQAINIGGDITCGNSTTNITSNCVQMGDVTSYSNSTIEKTYGSVKIGKITANNGFGIETSSIDAYVYGVHVGGNVQMYNDKPDISIAAIQVDGDIDSKNLIAINVNKGTIACDEVDKCVNLNDIKLNGGQNGITVNSIGIKQSGSAYGTAILVNNGISGFNSVGIQVNGPISDNSYGATAISAQNIDSYKGIQVNTITSDGKAIEVNGAITCGTSSNKATDNCVSIGDVEAYIYKVEYHYEEVEGEEVEVTEIIELPAISIGSITANGSSGVQIAGISSEYNGIEVEENVVSTGSGHNGIYVKGNVKASDGTGIVVDQNIEGFTGVSVDTITALNGGYGIYVGNNISVGNESYGLYINSNGIIGMQNSKPNYGIHISGDVNGGISVTGNVQGSGDSSQTAALYVGNAIIANGALSAISIKEGYSNENVIQGNVNIYGSVGGVIYTYDSVNAIKVGSVLGDQGKAISVTNNVSGEIDIDGSVEGDINIDGVITESLTTSAILSNLNINGYQNEEEYGKDKVVAILQSVDIKGDVDGLLKIDGTLHALDVSGRVGYSQSETAIQVGSVLGNIVVGTQPTPEPGTSDNTNTASTDPNAPNLLTQQISNPEDIPLKAADGKAIVQGSINVYGGIACSNNGPCVNIDGSVSAPSGSGETNGIAIQVGGPVSGDIDIDSVINEGNIKVNYDKDPQTTQQIQIGEIYVNGEVKNINIEGECPTITSNCISTLNTGDIGTINATKITGLLNLTYDPIVPPSPSNNYEGSGPTDVIKKIALYDSTDTTETPTPKLTISGITNKPEITSLKVGDVEIQTVTSTSIQKVQITSVDKNKDPVSIIGEIQLEPQNDNSQPLTIQGINNKFDISTIDTPGTITTLDAATIKDAYSNNMTLSPPPEYLTLAFNSSSSMESINIKLNTSDTNKITISNINSSFGIGSINTNGGGISTLTSGSIDSATINSIDTELLVTGNVQQATFNGDVQSVSIVGNVDGELTFTKLINSLSGGSVSSAQFSSIGDLTVNDGITGQITVTNNIASLSAGSIGTTETSTSPVLTVNGAITGGVSLNGGVNCGDTSNNISSACVSIGNITSYSKYNTSVPSIPSLKVGGITSNGGYGVLIDGDISATDNAIQVGQEQANQAEPTLYELNSTQGCAFALYGETHSQSGIRIATVDDANTIGGNVYSDQNGIEVYNTINANNDGVVVNDGGIIAKSNGIVVGSGGITANNGIQVNGPINANNGDGVTITSITSTGQALSVSGEIKCGEQGSPIVASCVSTSGIINYGQSSSNAVSISSVTAHGGNGINVAKSITSDSGSAISVGSTNIVGSGQITCGNGNTNTSNACISTGNIVSYTNSATATPTLNIDGAITSHGGNGIYIKDNIESFGDSVYVGGTVTVGATTSDSAAINVQGKITCGNSSSQNLTGSYGCIHVGEVEAYMNTTDSAITPKPVIDIGSITATNFQALNVGGAIQCGNENNPISRACVQTGSIESFAKSSASSLNVGKITSHGGSGVLILGGIITDNGGIYVNGEINVTGNVNGNGNMAIQVDGTVNCGNSSLDTPTKSPGCIDISAVNAYVYDDVSQGAKAAVYIGEITATNFQALDVNGAIQCGSQYVDTDNPGVNVNGGCVQMGNVITYGGDNANAIKTNSITAYNKGNGVYVGGTIDVQQGSGVNVNNGINVNSTGIGVQITKGKSVYKHAINAQGATGQGILITGDINSAMDGIKVNGDVSGGNGIYVTGSVTGNMGNGVRVDDGINSTSGVAIYVDKPGSSTYAIQGNVEITGSVNGLVKATGLISQIQANSTGFITVTYNIGQLSAGGIGTNAIITGNVGGKLQVTGTVGGSSVSQAINIGGQITCGGDNPDSNCVSIASINAGNNNGLNIQNITAAHDGIFVKDFINANGGTAISVGSYINTTYRALDIQGKTTCGTAQYGIGSGADCIHIGNVEAYAYEIYYQNVEGQEEEEEVTELYPAINIGAINSIKGDAINITSIVADNIGINISSIAADNTGINIQGSISTVDGSCFKVQNETTSQNAPAISLSDLGSQNADEQGALYIGGDINVGGRAISVKGNINTGFGEALYVGQNIETNSVENGDYNDAIHIVGYIQNQDSGGSGNGIYVGKYIAVNSGSAINIGQGLNENDGIAAITSGGVGIKINSGINANDTGNAISITGDVSANNGNVIQINGDVSSLDNGNGVNVSGTINVINGHGVNVGNIQVSGETGEEQYGVNTGTITMQNGIGVNVVSITSQKDGTKEFTGTSDGISVGTITVSHNGIVTDSITAGGYGIRVGNQLTAGSFALNTYGIKCGDENNLINGNCINIDGDIEAYLATTDTDGQNVYYSAINIIGNNTGDEDNKNDGGIKAINGMGINITGNIETHNNSINVIGSITSINANATQFKGQITGQRNAINVEAPMVSTLGPTVRFTNTITTTNNRTIYIGGDLVSTGQSEPGGIYIGSNNINSTYGNGIDLFNVNINSNKNSSIYATNGVWSQGLTFNNIDINGQTDIDATYP